MGFQWKYFWESVRVVFGVIFVAAAILGGISWVVLSNGALFPILVCSASFVSALVAVGYHALKD